MARTVIRESGSDSTISVNVGNPSGNVTGIVGDKGEQGIQGIQGKKGDPFVHSDFTPEELANLKGEQGIQGIQGKQGIQGIQGKPFVYSDFTEEELLGLVGPKGDKGLTGDKGDIGLTGPKGDTGADSVVPGPKGDKGPRGEKGLTGDTGTGINIVGSLNNASELPLTSSPGDAYIIKGLLYVWSVDSNSFIDVGNIKGEKGDKGDRGKAFEYGDFTESQLALLKGIKGDKGDKGNPFIYTNFTAPQLAGLKGDKGDTGLKGDTGDIGPRGLKGDTGAKGDIGPQGATGAVGATGLKGDTGTKGDTGPRGPQGETAAMPTIPSASTSVQGIVQLNNTVTSTSSTLAATANAVKLANDLAKAAIPSSQKGAVNGVATLGANGKVTPTQLPAVTPVAWGNITGNIADQLDLSELYYTKAEVDGTTGTLFNGLAHAALNGDYYDITTTAHPNVNIAADGKLSRSTATVVTKDNASNVAVASIQAGVDAPKIAYKKLTGTMGSSSTITSIPHGLDASKILSVNVTILAPNSEYVGIGQRLAAVSFTYRFDATHVTIAPFDSSSTNIFNRPYKILITYEV